MNSIDTPVFLVGSERSGTTLLRLMLDHHPKISFKFESEFMVSQIGCDGACPEIESYHDWLADQREFGSSGLFIDKRLDYVALVNDFLDQQRRLSSKSIVGTTVHNGFHRLRAIWPRAKYIYLYRDGRDVANSVVQMGWAGNVYVAADWWLRAAREWELTRRSLDKANWIEVRYEDLVSNPESQLERICSFVGVEYSDRMFEYARLTTYGLPDVRMIYQWKFRMEKSDIQLLEEKLGAQLLRRGYELSHHPRISVSAFRRRYLRMHSRVRSYFFRIRRYGFALAIQETFSRRLSLRPLYRNAIRKINQIDKAYLK